MKLGIAVGATIAVVVTVVAVIFLVFLPGSPEVTAEQQATSEAMKRFELRIEPRVWREAQGQSWFNKANPTPDGLRLLDLLAEYYVSQRSIDATNILRAYPDGLGEESEALLVQLKVGQLVRAVAISPWFIDGVTEHEAVYLTVLAEAWTRQGASWTFDDAVLQATKAPWFKDGLDEKEATVINAAADLSGRNQPKALKLIEGLQSNSFLYESVHLPLSGEKVLIVTAAPGQTEAQIAPALGLVKRWMVEVEGVTGLYNPRYILVSVEELNSLCGTGSGQGSEVPGFITLHLGCVTDTTVVHELTHVFAGSGPIWFSEGIADLLVFHLTGRNGNYFSTPAAGKIKVSYHRRRFNDTPPDYREQGALGARLLVDIYKIIGADQTFAVLKQIIAEDLPREDPLLQDLFIAGTPDSLKPRITTLFSDRFEAP